MSASTSTPRRNTAATRAERDRLRDYYGLGSSDTAADTSSSSPRRPTEAPATDDSATKYKQLIKDQGIAGLLKAQSDLLTGACPAQGLQRDEADQPNDNISSCPQKYANSMERGNLSYTIIILTSLRLARQYERCAQYLYK